MKKIYAFILSGAAILAVTACNKETQVEDPAQNNGPVYETLSVKIGTETKVTLNTDDAKSAFEEHDKIAVWTDADEFQTCSVDGEGKITVDISGGARSNYAVYYNGATIPTYESSTLSITLPDTYNYNDVADTKNPVPMVAKNVSGESGDMTFYAVGTLLRITVKAIPSGATGLVFQFPNRKVNGTFAVSNPGTTSPSIDTGTPEAAGEDKITVNFAAAGTATEMTLNIPLPTGPYEDVFITPVGGDIVGSVRHIKAGGYTANRAVGKQLTATLVSFSVAANKKVVFAPGNLQYLASSGNWRFAEQQYLYIGNAAGNTSSGSRETQSNWIDLFGWGTSGWDNRSVYSDWYYFHPYDSSDGYFSGSDNIYRYGPGEASLTGVNANGDWGIFNQIGFYSPGFWITPTNDYYLYLLQTRSASTINGVANAKYAKATINGKKGLIIFPDSYSHPLPEKLPAASSINLAKNDTYGDTIYTLDEWNVIEAAGAVFLPMAGYRVRFAVTENIGEYWTSVYASGYSQPKAYARALYFTGTTVSGSYAMQRYRGSSVRLVRELN